MAVDRTSGLARLFAVAWAPLLVVATHVVMDLGLRVYERYPWLDGPMHVAGGVAMAYAILTALGGIEPPPCQNRWVARGLVVCATATVAIFWEFAEFVADQALGTNLQVSLANTMKDLAAGLLGAVSLALGRIPRSTPRGR